MKTTAQTYVALSMSANLWPYFSDGDNKYCLAYKVVERNCVRVGGKWKERMYVEVPEKCNVFYLISPVFPAVEHRLDKVLD